MHPNSNSSFLPLDRYLPGLIVGDEAGLESMFDGAPCVDDPFQGRIDGREAFSRFVERRHARLAARQAWVEQVGATATGTRVVQESILHLHGEREIALPVAVAGDLGANGWTALRVYHSAWPLEGRHRVRAPLLPPDETLVLPDVVGRYMKALAAGDTENILQQFEPDGYAREPSGGRYHYQGLEALRRFYTALFGNVGNGGIPLEHCTATDDGVCCAVEYNVVQWGRTTLPPQAGVAVYVQGASGLLHAVRIYDDVDPPS